MSKRHVGRVRSTRRRRRQKLPLLIVIIILVILGVLGWHYFFHQTGNGAEQEAANTVPDQVEVIPDGELKITMLDVGQGLSLVIQNGEYCMLYDGGGRETSSKVVSYLLKNSGEELTYLFASHYDEDHIAGLVGALNAIPVDTVVCPDYESDTHIYQSFRKKLSDSGAKEIHPNAGDEFSLGDAKVQVLGPENYEAAEENNRSIAVKITFGKFSCVITGDAQEEEEKQLLDSGEQLKANLLVAGHHGSANACSGQFLQAVDPEAVWISVGAGNMYGHPAESTMKRLQKSGVEMFRTDLQGDISVVTDGVNWEYSTAPCDDWSSGTVEE